MPTKRLMMTATAKPGKLNADNGPQPVIKGQASAKWVACMTIITASVSRLRRCARMTPAIQAFQASSTSASASDCKNGAASSNTSAGALSIFSMGRAHNRASIAANPPIQVPEASAAHATRSASDRCPAPRFCVMTTLTPAPTRRKTMNNRPNTWWDSAKAPPAASDIRAASAVPTMPTTNPSDSSMNRGKTSVAMSG